MGGSEFDEKLLGDLGRALARKVLELETRVSLLERRLQSLQLRHDALTSTVDAWRSQSKAGLAALRAQVVREKRSNGGA